MFAIKRFGLIILLLCLTIVTIASCQPSNLLKSSANQPPQLVTSILSDPKTFNPALSSESPNIFGYTYDGLIEQNPFTSQIEPALAESWQVSDDKSKIVVTLRPELKWSDGQPLTADDVVFTFNDIYLNEAIPTDVRDILRIGKSRKLPSVRKIDQRQIEFTVPEPFRPFLIALGVPILPAHALRASVTTKDKDGKPQFLTKWGVDTPPEQIIVNGPYKLERYDTSQRIIFQRNPYYWRKGVKGDHLPYIERIVWQIVQSTDTSLLQFRSGGLDTVGVDPDYFSLLKTQEKQGDFKIYNGGPSSQTLFTFFNLNKGSRNGKPLIDPIKSRWFNSREFRQAIAYAIDRQTMLNNIYYGLGQLQNSPIPVQSPYYLSPEKGLKVYNFDPKKSRQLLIKAGFKYNADQQLEDAGGNKVRFTLLTNTGNKIREGIGAQIKENLHKIGIQVDFTPLAWSTFTDKLSNTLDWEAALIGLGGGLEPNDRANVWSPEGQLHMFNQKPSKAQKPIEGREVEPWEVEIGELFIQGAQEFDPVKVTQIYAKFQQLAQENLPFIHLVDQYTMTAIKNHFTGIRYSALGGAFWNIYEIKINK